MLLAHLTYRFIMSLSSKYNNIKVQVSCVPNYEKEIKLLFFRILDDYINRFNVEIIVDKANIQICFIEYDDPKGDTCGLHIFSEDNKKILIQIRDPLLHGWEGNPYTMDKMANIVCHEFVHACQALTGRNGFSIPKLTYDKNDEQEQYFFDPCEVEARALEAPYTTMYAQALLL